MTTMAAHVSVVALILSLSVGPGDASLGWFRVQGQPNALDITGIARELLAELGPDTQAVNRTLSIDDHSSYHMFATNRYDPCLSVS